MPVPDGERLFIADGGLETTMIFREGFELPEFAAFVLLDRPEGRDALRRYHADFISIAGRNGAGYVLDTPTWRASAGWGEKLGYSAAEIADVNRSAVELANQIRAGEEDGAATIAVCGMIGPQGDGYQPAEVLESGAAESYHAAQVEVFAEAGVDFIAAITLTYADEAIGLVRAAGAAGTPIAISFTVETDGRLPSEEPLDEAIERVDAETAGAAAFFMINCAHPTHFASTIEHGGPWLSRLGGIRANASRQSHRELDEADRLDDGDPTELAREYRELGRRLPELRVLGGCCGTDKRHIAAICDAWEM